MRSMDIGATGMLAQQLNVDVISNNIANMTTTGYKRQHAEFSDLIYQNRIRPGTQSSDQGTIVPAGIQLGLGVKTAGVFRVHEQGPLKNTSAPLDIAITGNGFFQIEMPNGDTAYTRAGNFQLNQDGEIVTQQGYRLQPGITVPDDTLEIQINESGEVFAKIEGQVNLQNVGQIELASFVNEPGLEAIGDNLLLETEASGSPQTGTAGADEFGVLRQGFVETSNVNAVEEITNLIAAQRAYEMNSNIIQTSDEMMNTTNQLR